MPSPLLRRLAAALAFAALAGAAEAQTGAISLRADRQPLAQAYGEAVAARVFSSALDAPRQAALAASLQRVPGFSCGATPQTALVAVFPWRGVRDRRAWIERYQVACSPVAYRNLLMIEEGAGARAIELAPGRSNTDPQLQRDLMTGIVAAAARHRPPNCAETPVVTNVDLDAMEGQGAWRETWHVSQCGKAAQAIRVGFSPSPQGGTTWRISAGQ